MQGSPVKQLVLATDFHGPELPSGDVQPQYTNLLAWAIIYLHSAPDFRGGRGNIPTSTAGFSCTSLTLVEARSGSFLSPIQDCS